MMLRNNVDYKCEIDKSVTKYSSWTFNLNQYLINLMSTHLYLDLLSNEEKAARGKPIKKPAGMLPVERTKISMLRHGNEADLLRKIQASFKGKKNVRFNANTKGKQPSS